MEVDGGQGVEFRLPLDSMLEKTDAPKLELVKRYRLYPASESNDGYLLDLEVAVVNNNDKPVKVAVRQEGPAGLTLEGWWYSVKISQAWFSAAGIAISLLQTPRERTSFVQPRDIFNFAKKNAAQPTTVLLSEGEPMDTRTLKYIGVDSQYFNASMMPHPNSPQSLGNLSFRRRKVLGDTNKINRDQIQAANNGFWIDTTEVNVESPGKVPPNVTRSSSVPKIRTYWLSTDLI